MTLVAALLLAPTAFAQTDLPVQYKHEKYLLNDEKTIGYNKYLVSNQPDANGEYTLRIENFVTGVIKENALPTDFVLVLDASGSMWYDYKPTSGNTINMPMIIETNDDTLLPYFVNASSSDLVDPFTRYTPYYIFKNGELGGTGSGTAPGTGTQTRYYDTPFWDETTTSHYQSQYYYYEDPAKPENTAYYKLFRRMFDASDGHLLETSTQNVNSNSITWYKYPSAERTGTRVKLSAKPANVLYNVAIKLKDGTYKYLNGTGLSDERTDVTATTTILYINQDNKIYRIKHRNEALLEGVRALAELLEEENGKDSQWEEGVTRHQVSVVQFSNTGSYQDRIDELTTKSATTHVVMKFDPVTDADTFMTTLESRIAFSGSTFIDLGVNLAKLLLQSIQNDTQLAKSNRQKVVIVFTDGEPSNHTDMSYFGTVKPTLNAGKTIKEKGSGKINGDIYTIDLCMKNTSYDFLQHLSSNYPNGNADGASDTQGYNHNLFAGTQEADHFYKDSSHGDLTEIFKQIGKAATGESRSMVAVDVMSDDFVIPFTTTDVSKVKMYTAQCIGTKEIDGETYLAFAREVPAPTREAVSHLWVPRSVTEDGVTKTVWVDLGDPNPSDIDGTSTTPKLTFTVSADGKKIIVKGFNYAEYFCGVDPDETHTTGVNANERQMAADDYNAAYADPDNKYRGFKLIFEFPIVLDPDALGGVNVPTNNVDASGLFLSDGNGNPITENPEVNYPTPDLPVPVRLIIQKTGLKPGESASFTVQRKLRTDTTGEYDDYTSFVLTGDATNTPEVRIINLDPAYYYKVKESNWSWAYQNVSSEYYSTDPEDPNAATSNPIVFKNDPIPTPPPHAEAKATNKMTTWEGETSSTSTVNSK